MQSANPPLTSRSSSHCRMDEDHTASRVLSDEVYWGAHASFSLYFFVHISGEDFWLLFIWKVTNHLSKKAQMKIAKLH